MIDFSTIDNDRLPDILATTEFDDLLVRHHVPVFRPHPWLFTQERIDMEVRWAACDHPRWVDMDQDFIRGLQFCVECRMPRKVEEHPEPEVCTHIQCEPMDDWVSQAKATEWVFVVVTHPCEPDIPAPASPS